MTEANLETKLRNHLSGLCRRDLAGIDLDADLIEHLGLDSLGGLRLLAAVEKRFQVRFPDQRLEEFRTLRRLLEFIDKPSGEPP
jgi:acyl carrier protein